MICVFFLLWLTSYYVILAYCVLCAVLWVGGVGVYNVDIPLFVCDCFLDTPVCVLHAGCLNLLLHLLLLSCIIVLDR